MRRYGRSATIVLIVTATLFPVKGEAQKSGERRAPRTPVTGLEKGIMEFETAGYTCEGLHEWMVHSKSYAETAWKEAEQWNTPTSAL